MDHEVEESLIKSISEPGMEIAPELLELGIDELANNEAVTKIPVVGTIFALGKTAAAVRDWLFVRNILAFLNGLGTLDQDKKTEWVEKLKVESFQAKVGEELFSIINRMNDIKKSKVAGRLFATYIDGHIDYDIFIRLCEKLDRLLSMDLRAFKDDVAPNDDEKERYRSIGLYKIHFPGVKHPEMIQFMSNQELIPNEDHALITAAIKKT